MTKLLEWLFGAVFFISIWILLISNSFKNRFIEEWMGIFISLPFIIIGLFGVYAASVVLWRVFTFNDCEDAAIELQKEILQAKEDLTRRGFIFEQNDKKSQ